MAKRSGIRVLGTWTVGNTKRTIALIPAKYLFVDYEFQRDMKTHKLNRIVAEWTPHGMRSLVVRKRATKRYSVLDGQHRGEAWKQVYSENDLVLCEVLDLKSPAQEAAVFTILNQSAPVTGNPKFRANLYAGEHNETRIKELVNKYGFEIWLGGPGRPDTAIDRAIMMKGAGNLLTIYTKMGEEVFEKMLEVIRDVYWHKGPQPMALRPDFRMGLAMFLSTIPSHVSTKSITLALRRSGIPADAIKADVDAKVARRGGSRFDIYETYAEKFKDIGGIQYRALAKAA